MRRALLAAAAASASACLLAGCGGNPGDLLGMQISGGPVRGVEQMHVTEDGRTSCNKGGLHQLGAGRHREYLGEAVPAQRHDSIW